MEPVNEFLDLSPIGLDIYGYISGSPIYSNEKIINKVISWLNKSTITRPIINSILEGINKRVILIGYENRSKLSFVLRRWKQMKDTSSGSYVVGFFSPLDAKLVILLDDNVGIFGKALIEIPPIIIHELCHFSAYNDIHSFIHMTSDKFLLPFYNNLFDSLAPNVANVDNNYLKKTLSDLGIQNETGSDPSNISSSIPIWRNYLSQKYDNKEIDKIILSMGIPLKLILSGKLSNPNNLSIAKSSYSAYCKAYSRMKQKVCQWSQVGQEFSYPSEVICVLSQWGMNPTVVRLINNINYSRYV